jgi:hypothetical protein
VATSALPIQSPRQHEPNKNAGAPQTNTMRRVPIGRADTRRAAIPRRIPWPGLLVTLTSPHLPLSLLFFLSLLTFPFPLLGLSTGVKTSPQNCRHCRRRTPNVSGICTAGYNLGLAGGDALIYNFLLSCNPPCNCPTTI